MRNLVPGMEQVELSTPFCSGSVSAMRFKPWLNEDDPASVLFISSHGFGKKSRVSKDEASGPWFYPGSGATADHLANEKAAVAGADAEAAAPPASDDAASRMVCNVGLERPSLDAVPGTARNAFRNAYRDVILPRLVEFNPDLLLISAGFDAHKKDELNFGYVSLVEDDYEWVTAQLVKVANSCCEGRIVSVLEGGYSIKGRYLSAFARSTAAHVRALVDGSIACEHWDADDTKWESAHEGRLLQERQRKAEAKAQAEAKQQLERVRTSGASRARRAARSVFRSMTYPPDACPQEIEKRKAVTADGDYGDAADSSHGAPSKRRRPDVDYVALAQQLEAENQSAAPVSQEGNGPGGSADS